jgi:hypothetical protein
VAAHPDDDAYGVAAVVALLVRRAMLEHRNQWDDMNTPEATEEQPAKSVSRRPGDRVADGPPGPGAHRHLRRPLTPADKPSCRDSPEPGGGSTR